MPFHPSGEEHQQQFINDAIISIRRATTTTTADSISSFLDSIDGRCVMESSTATAAHSTLLWFAGHGHHSYTFQNGFFHRSNGQFIRIICVFISDGSADEDCARQHSKSAANDGSAEQKSEFIPTGKIQ
jgi:hypothetical protein